MVIVDFILTYNIKLVSLSVFHGGMDLNKK